jgi:hypothetical protein
MDLARLTDDDLLAATSGRPEVFGEFYARHETAVREGQGDGTCRHVNENPALGGTVAWLPVLVDGRAAIAALAADDVPELENEFGDGRVETQRFVDSAVLVPAEPWPSDLSWRNGAGGYVGVELTPEEHP